MYSDTHFHFHYLSNNFGASYGAQLFSEMAVNDTFFALDIGTKHNDLLPRLECAKESLDLILDSDVKSKAYDMLYFSAGIWPDPDSIADREARVQCLEQQIECAKNSFLQFEKKIIAIGECGLDHHWNASSNSPDGTRFYDKDLVNKEKEMFCMQLDLAKKFGLPAIIHTREAFNDTIDCLNIANYNKGIIHCFSYGKDEARVFLDKGWYIALGGAVTYAKKKNMDEMKSLVAYIPSDRLLLETDAPYLAPVPFRGKCNTPLLIQHTYDFISEARGISCEALSALVDENIKDLFGI